MSEIELNEKEPHPCAIEALHWIKSNHTVGDLFQWQEAFASCAIEGNRSSQICGETLRRIMDGEKVSDRYVLGLAWAMQGDK